MTTKEQNIKAMVLYTDGGCRPNPGYAGCGIHGYSYEVQKSVKGIGHTTHAAGAQGYNFKNNTSQTKLTKEEYQAYCELDRAEQISFIEKMCQIEERVTVLEFFDASYTTDGSEHTNNTAELIAATRAIMFAIDEGVSVLTLRIDSMLVIQGITEWVDGWKKNGWRTKTGSEVRNSDLWEDLIVVRDKFKLAGNLLRVVWVKGHSEDIGNQNADYLATLSVYTNQDRAVLAHMHRSPPEGYWSTGIEHKHPMLTHRYSFFVANESYKSSNTYYLSSQGKEADMIAKKSSEAGYAVVQLDTGEPMLNMVVDKQCDMPNELQSMYLVDVEELYGSSFRYLKMFGERALFKRIPTRFDLWTPSDTPITRELQPPIIAMRAIDALVGFTTILDGFLNGTAPGVTGVDITDLIFDSKEVKDKKGAVSTVTTIKPDFTVGQASLKVQAEVAGVADKVELVLTSGIDIAERNMFKRIEHLNPKVHVITWGVDPLCFHYATVVQADGCRGIWGGPFSNVRVLETPRAV